MSTAYFTELNTLNNIFAVFRDLNEDGQMSIQAAHTFILIAQNPGCTQQLIIDQAGLSQSSASRNVVALSEWVRPGKRGLGLVEVVIDPNNTRQKRIFLTARGRLTASKVIAAQKGMPVGSEASDFESPTGKQFVNGIFKAARG